MATKEKNLKFQVLDIGDDDVDFKYVVTLYGKYKKKNIVCHVSGFKPSFYVRVPLKSEKENDIEFKKIIEKSLELILTKEILKNEGIIDKTIKEICNVANFNGEEILVEQGIDKIKLSNKINFYTDQNCNYYCGMEKSKIIKEKSFYNFSFDEDEKFAFYKLSFTSNFSMMKYINAIKSYYNYCMDHFDEETKSNKYLKEWLSLKENNCDCEANLYESKISPILKFIHETKIKSCGWVSIDLKKNKTSDVKFECDNEYSDIPYKNIKALDNDEISDFVICSFDIECDSSHGDFPNPKKTFKRLATEIYENLLLIPNLLDLKINKFFITRFIDIAFSKNKIEDDTYNKFKDNISKIFTNKLFSNLDELLKFSNLEEVLELFEKSDIFKDCDEFRNPKNRNKNIKEIDKILEKLKHIDENGIKSPITVNGDPIIQIGNVFYNYKKDKFKRIIVVYKDGVTREEVCTDLYDDYEIEVINCISEKELLEKWVEVVNDNNPDFITGYNIFGFDFNFITERVDVLFPCPKGSDGKFLCKKFNKSIDHCPNCPKNKFYKIGKIKKNFKDSQGHYLYRNKICQSMNKELSSSGLGDNELKFIQMDGRILFDMMKEVMKGHALESYKLDTVASHFMRGKVEIIRYIKENPYYHTILKTNNFGNLKVGDYIILNVHTKWGNYNYLEKKFLITKIILDKNTIIIRSDEKIVINDSDYIEWCMAKDDISPQDIFDKHKNGNADDRALIAKYCIMDCEICIHLMLILDIVPNNMGMAKVCSVPLSFIFLRGQGVKVNSLVTKACNEYNIKIPTLKAYDPNNKEGFEGAIVLDPVERNTTGMYLDDPIVVVDYASLYPSSIIENNFSHETFICTEKDYLENPEKYNNFKEKDNEEFKDFKFSKATYDDYEFTEKFKKGDYVNIKDTEIVTKILKVEKSKQDDDDTKYYILEDQENKFIAEKLSKVEDKKWDKNKLETKTTCYFKSQFNNYDENVGPNYGIIPRILKTLLDQRSATKKLLKQAKTEDKKKVLDGLQLAYKVTANSVYGQMGAKTSSIFFKKIAACTTAIGRQRIYDAEDGSIKWVNSLENNLICKDESIVKKEDRAKIVYGDTDSVFIKFSRYNIDGKLLTGPDAIKHCINCGIKVGKYITDNYLNKDFKGFKYQGQPIEETEFKGPQDLEYEKTFENFILISKKRYIGDKHEFVYLEDPKRTSMGIVMKRRDNAPIVKYVYGNILEILMKQKDLNKAKEWLDLTLNKIMNGEMNKDNIEMFVVSKSLRGYYKKPETIAHKVLADRIAERDPGNKPKPNDRIPYAYWDIPEDQRYDSLKIYKSGKNKDKPKKKKILQGNRIEHRDYIIENKLKLDYKFYISNQIMKPVKQLLEIQLKEKEIDEIFNKYID